MGPDAPDHILVTFIDHQDGAIINAGQVQQDTYDLQYLAPGASRLAVPPSVYRQVAQDLRRWCLIAGEVTARIAPAIALPTTSIAADGEEEAVITGIPEGASLRVEGAVRLPPATITGGEATLTCATPGTLRLRLSCPAPWRDWEGVVHAV